MLFIWYLTLVRLSTSILLLPHGIEFDNCLFYNQQVTLKLSQGKNIMNMFKRQNNFILIFLLISCITAMFGMGLEEHALSDIGNSNTSCISNQSFTTSDNITTIHVSEGNLALAIIKGIRNSSRQKSFGRNNVLLIFILTILSGVFRLTQEIYGFYNRLYVRQRYYLISYIHAKDGCKRLISCWWKSLISMGESIFYYALFW